MADGGPQLGLRISNFEEKNKLNIDRKKEKLENQYVVKSSSMKTQRENYIRHILYDLLLEENPMADLSQIANYKFTYYKDKSSTSDNELVIFPSSEAMGHRIVNHKYGKQLLIKLCKQPEENNDLPEQVGEDIKNNAFFLYREGKVDKDPKYANPDTRNYQIDNAVKSESRHTEYKSVKNTKDVWFQLEGISAKYMSAFLNSDGGNLVLGVNDNCKVDGVNYGADKTKEDKDVEWIIRRTAKFMHPPIPERLYDIKFYQLSQPGKPGNLFKRVVEVNVEKGEAGQFYASPWGNMFIRREGSIETIPAKHVYEVSKQILERNFQADLEEIRRRKESSQNLFVRGVHDHKSFKEQMDRLEEENGHLKKDLRDLNKQITELNDDKENYRQLYSRFGEKVKPEMERLERFKNKIEEDINIHLRNADDLMNVPREERDDTWLYNMQELERVVGHRINTGFMDMFYTLPKPKVQNWTPRKQFQ